jgi:zinc protease
MKITHIFLFLFFITTLTQAQPLPIDPKIRYGKLENGLTYYIRANQKPKQRAEFFIAQNVGAILENDNQNGLAHFLEHMAFNGTTHFPGKSIINYFEKIGVKFGANINAHTALDETVYNLSDVPTIRESIIDSALLVLHDWSGFISLDSKEIDAERGVIREEWRTGAGPERRMWKESNRLKYPGSQYAKRDVIGDTAIINNFEHKTLRNFYQKWYRPDLQAILIVGDLDVDKVEAKIKKLFSDIPKKENAAKRAIYTIENNTTPIVSIVKDPEARTTRIELEYKHDILPADVKLSMVGYVKNTKNALISNMMDNRFEEITQQANAPYVGGQAFYGELVKSKDAFQILVVPKEGKELEGLKALLKETEKMKRFGFTNSELTRAKANMLKRMKTAFNERDNQENNDLIEEYVRNFLNHEVIPGIEWEYAAMQTFLTDLKLQDINELAKSYITDSNLIVSIMAPDKPKVKIPTENEILQAVKDSKTVEITARKEEKVNQNLINKAPTAGVIKTIAQNPILNTTEWILNNGVKVIIRPTTFKKDEILLSAYSFGGLSKIKIEDLPSALFADDIVSNNGLGKYSSVELDKILTGKIASVSPSIDQYEEGLSGGSSVQDFETMMQLLYLHFTAPRKDDDAFKAMMNGYRTSFANSATDPRKAFSDSLSATLSNHNARNVLMNLKKLELVNQNKALSIYKERFANPADFTFLFTGNIDPKNELVKQAICTYLGGLKSYQNRETFTDNNIRKPLGKVNNYFTKEMKVKKATNYILYSAAMPYNITNKTTVTAIGSILNIRYIESIREKEGGSYGVSVRGNMSNTPIDEAVISMKFDTDPEKQARLMGIIHAEVAEIVANGPRPDDLQKVKENMLKKLTEDLAENSWWQCALVQYYKYGFDFVTDYKPAIEGLTSDSIRETLKKIVAKGNVIEVVMKPNE